MGSTAGVEILFAYITLALYLPALLIALCEALFYICRLVFYINRRFPKETKKVLLYSPLMALVHCVGVVLPAALASYLIGYKATHPVAVTYAGMVLLLIVKVIYFECYYDKGEEKRWWYESLKQAVILSIAIYPFFISMIGAAIHHFLK